MTGRLSGKAAIVTGGARGLGLVFVRALLAEGAQVLAVDIADIGAAEAAGARAMRADITQAAGEVARACQEAFGRIDILVNNAALYASLPVARYDAIDLETWDRVMALTTPRKACPSFVSVTLARPPTAIQSISRCAMRRDTPHTEATTTESSRGREVALVCSTCVALRTRTRRPPPYSSGTPSLTPPPASQWR